MIPRVIHYCWFGGGDIPDGMKGCISSWEKIMPDYEIRLWTEGNYDVSRCAYMKEAYDAGKWAFASDYARLDLCYTCGGIYLDADVEALKPFDDLLSLEAFCGIERGRDDEPEGVNFGLGFGCVRGQKVIRTLRDYYHSLHFRKPDGSLELKATIPVITTKVLSHLGLRLVNERQCIEGLTVLPKEYLCPMNQYTGKLTITQQTHSIHYYSASWFSHADQERRELRRQYSFLGNLASEIVSSFIAYRRHYGLVGMWKNILQKLIGRFSS